MHPVLLREPTLTSKRILGESWMSDVVCKGSQSRGGVVQGARALLSKLNPTWEPHIDGLTTRVSSIFQCARSRGNECYACWLSSVLDDFHEAATHRYSKHWSSTVPPQAGRADKGSCPEQCQASLQQPRVL